MSLRAQTNSQDAQNDMSSIIERIRADRHAKYPYSTPFVQICPSGTRLACPSSSTCDKAHFVKVLRRHTYVHYELEDPGSRKEAGVAVAAPTNASDVASVQSSETTKQQPLPPEWINADLRTLDLSVLGKFDVVVADPPWAIHQELPYGTMTDHEMLNMSIGTMQEEGGLLFLWVTGRAMELGRECLTAWGYERIDEIIWIKMNQLQGLIRTGRTGHWLNHSKEHCIVAIRKTSNSSTTGSTTSLRDWYTRGVDTQVIVSEVRQTSRKPDELYDMVERVLGGKLKGRKVELFGRKHNLRPGWLTVGNQLGESDQVFDEQLVQRFNDRYPDRKIVLSQSDQVSPVKLDA
ncbi:hypothetical protein ACM66B_004193 [Microbotryomycetes sp. NB124-2]